METIRETKESLCCEYLRFCKDMMYNSKNKLVIEDFAKHFIEHYIGCFGYFNNDFFIVKDLELVKNEIIKTIINACL